MVFIRKKKVSGKIYYYLVENKMVNGKVQQKVLMYLGTAQNLLNKLGSKNQEIVISDLKYFEAKQDRIYKDGAKKFHVVADFDKTLTKAFVNGEKMPSIISELRSRGFLGKEYSKKAQELFDYYHKIEIDLKIPLEEKKEKMEEWWGKHYEILIKMGLTKKHIKKVVDDGKIQFRKGVLEFLDLLHEKDIPLIILSSSGIGDAIPMFLKKINKNYKNIHVISNFFKWNNKGKAIKINEPVIHSMNKSETSLESFDFYKKIKYRQNVLLLGDGIGDVEMVKGFLYDALIKIGFLNDNLDENLQTYKELFDIVILNDGSFNFINEFIKKIK